MHLSPDRSRYCLLIHRTTAGGTFVTSWVTWVTENCKPGNSHHLNVLRKENTISANRLLGSCVSRFQRAGEAVRDPDASRWSQRVVTKEKWCLVTSFSSLDWHANTPLKHLWGPYWWYIFCHVEICELTTN